MNDNLEKYIDYRIEKAFDSFEDARLLFTNQRWNACVNRLYYACFYITIALLVKEGVETTTHEGVRTQLGKLFVKPGIIDKRHGKLYTKLFDYRLKGDYGDFFDFDESLVSPLIPMVEEYLLLLKEMIFISNSH